MSMNEVYTMAYIEVFYVPHRFSNYAIYMHMEQKSELQLLFAF